MSEEAAILMVQEHAVVLSTRMSVLGKGRCFVLGSLIASRTVLQENMIVVCSRQLTVISYDDLDFRYFRVLRRMTVVHATKNQNLSSCQ